MAELETGMRAEGTKAAVKAAKVRGTKLGITGFKRAEENRAMSLEFARQVSFKIDQAKREGAKSCQEIAWFLDDERIPTRNGGIWHPTTVRRVMARLDAEIEILK